MTSELQFGFKEHSSTIKCSTLLDEAVEYDVSNNYYVYVLLTRRKHLIDYAIPNYSMCLKHIMCALSLDDYCIIFILVLKCMYNGTPLIPRHFPYKME